jgi:hypothetical protein
VFDAFISYSRAVDGRLATALHKGLHHRIEIRRFSMKGLACESDPLLTCITHVANRFKYRATRAGRATFKRQELSMQRPELAINSRLRLPSSP